MVGFSNTVVPKAEFSKRVVEYMQGQNIAIIGTLMAFYFIFRKSHKSEIKLIRFVPYLCLDFFFLSK